MPRWGRPPGARLGRQTRRRMHPWMDEGDMRVEEIDSEEEFLLRQSQAFAARPLARMEPDGRGGWARQMLTYGDDYDDAESIDGVDYDLYDDADSTVAYAVQLAMKDKEDWLVEKALERIRRAQMLGQKNVRLSKRELEALERKRTHTGGTRNSARTASALKAESSRHLANGHGGNITSPRGGNITPRKQTSPYSKGDGNEGYGSWPRASGVQTPPRSHSLRTPVPGTSPRSPRTTTHSDHLPPSPLARSPASLKSPTLARPLPDDPHWVPPFQMSQSPYMMHSPTDPRRGPPGRPGSVPFMTGYPPPPFGDRLPNGARQTLKSYHTPSASASEDSPHEEESESDDSGDEVQMVDVVERRVSTGTPTRTATHRGSRQRSNRP